MSKMTYRPEIDGLRSIAVFAVIFYHMKIAGFGGGFFGVDVFFVISGYLITRIGLIDLNNKQYSLSAFYERRIRRIIPVLLLVLTISWLLAWISLTPLKFEKYCKSLIGVLTFSSNFIFWQESGYFNTDSDLKPLLHTWSLAVEEQFYLLFPGLLWIFTRPSPRQYRWMMGGLFIFSIAWMDRMSWLDSAGNFFLLPSRLWELLAGCLLARSESFLGYRKGAEKAGAWMTPLALIALIYSIIFLDESVRHPGPWTFLPVGATALLIHFSGYGDKTSQLLASRPLVWLGLISYSLYLWHQPLVAYIRVSPWKSLFENYKFLLVAFMILLSYLSWKWVENPFRQRQRWNKTSLYRGMTIVGLIFFTLSIGGLLTKGYSRLRFYDQHLAVLDYAEYPGNKLMSEGKCLVPFHFDGSQYKIENCTQVLSSSDPNTYIVWGDSFAGSLYPGLIQSSDQGRWIQMTAAGCAPLLDFDQSNLPKCRSINRLFFSSFSKSSATHIIMVANWSRYYKIFNFRESLSATIKQLKASGVKVTLVGVLPEWNPNLPEQIVEFMKNNNHVPEYLHTSLLPELKMIDQILNMAAKENQISFISILEKACRRNNECKAVLPLTQESTAPPILVAWDYGHPTKEGSHFYGQLIVEELSLK